MTTLSRRAGSALVAGILGSGFLAGCSTGPTEASDTSQQESTTQVDAHAFPVTIEHAFGETTIEEEPTRVATLGWTDQDVALALGVPPVGATAITWGGNTAGSTEWYDDELEELGAEQATRYSDADGAPVDEIAKLAPDLILATNSGLTAGEYKKLSRIAPVVAYPEAPWVTSWQDSLDMVGEALGRSELADEIEGETQASIDAAAEEHPEIQGKTFIYAALSTTDTSKVDYYTPEDLRPQLLTEIGMKNAPVIEKLSEKGEFYGTVSAERAAELESDVFITYAEKKSDLEAYTEDPLLGQIPAIESGHVLASTNKADGLGFSSPSPLSIPWAMDNFVPQIAEAVAGT
ncbi:iron-siderophore ABC transporter substrate-binding protein [Nocardioides sp.]|uniref:iron-siderophore ABC transporter substrate-binding protein n=1 Tax=Nocardioides sp. TaxID=35761 RepID=UPI002D7EDF1E|nr:iron-siderophore ABC transporter substrate-binding protein [Nocardioides sp.]HET8960885.1 iron-siderophore ABC transporter substrate-binding protein [Nocardioides sp.]